ncbi:hypothetical protein DFH06DRAFT_1226202, partial [Mycena polygramma]
MSFEVRTDRVRLAVQVTRKAGMSKEDFRRYWTEVHGPLFAGLNVVKANVLKYEQAHINQETSDRFRAAGFPVPEFTYDGFAILEAESYEKALEVFQSEEFKVALKDGDNFMNHEKTQFIPLDLVTAIDKA